LALLSAAAVSLAPQSASAGLFDGGSGCGCGTAAYTYAPAPYVVMQTRTIIRPVYVVAPTSYGNGPEATVEYWHRHHHYRHFGWRHHY
jgi:hypothetical protein